MSLSLQFKNDLLKLLLSAVYPWVSVCGHSHPFITRFTPSTHQRYLQGSPSNLGE